MYSDSDILKDVTAELKMEPSLRDDDIAVGVREGVVTLAGYVDSYADKWRAERIASKMKELTTPGPRAGPGGCGGAPVEHSVAP